MSHDWACLWRWLLCVLYPNERKLDFVRQSVLSGELRLVQTICSWRWMFLLSVCIGIISPSLWSVSWDMVDLELPSCLLFCNSSSSFFLCCFFFWSSRRIHSSKEWILPCSHSVNISLKTGDRAGATRRKKTAWRCFGYGRLYAARSAMYVVCDDQNGRGERDGSEFLLDDVYMIVLGFRL